MIFIALWGFFVGTVIQNQVSYCECFRDSFNGAYCESIKGSGAQGSCHK